VSGRPDPHRTPPMSRPDQPVGHHQKNPRGGCAAPARWSWMACPRRRRTSPPMPSRRDLKGFRPTSTPIIESCAGRGPRVLQGALHRSRRGELHGRTSRTPSRSPGTARPNCSTAIQRSCSMTLPSTGDRVAGRYHLDTAVNDVVTGRHRTPAGTERPWRTNGRAGRGQRRQQYHLCALAPGHPTT